MSGLHDTTVLVCLAYVCVRGQTAPLYRDVANQVAMTGNGQTSSGGDKDRRGCEEKQGMVKEFKSLLGHNLGKHGCPHHLSAKFIPVDGEHGKAPR